MVHYVEDVNCCFHNVTMSLLRWLASILTLLTTPDPNSVSAAQRGTDVAGKKNQLEELKISLLECRGWLLMRQKTALEIMTTN